ncbi:hypothetical protein ATANTOWER_028603 [Ataeniobius toweri]|uniref:C-type lectin domain-containing protein n=1 Tax=Ataeniobius toweri TaxID=208326 RepID=A0ABU7ARW2_9TELE|nr:hypothetical protein [Ataeniobius toweri]
MWKKRTFKQIKITRHKRHKIKLCTSISNGDSRINLSDRFLEKPLQQNKKADVFLNRKSLAVWLNLSQGQRLGWDAATETCGLSFWMVSEASHRWSADVCDASFRCPRHQV